MANFVLITGDRAILDCQATNYDPNAHSISSFTWSHNNTIINIDEQGNKYIVGGTAIEKQLTINSSEFEDAGTYTCTIEYSTTGSSQRQSVSDQDMLRIGSKKFVYITLDCVKVCKS